MVTVSLRPYHKGLTLEAPDTTPTITMAYDRVGNLTEATTAGIVTNLYAYDIVGHCTNEWQNDFNLTRYYDTLGRSTGYAINGTRQTTIAYDTYGRISTMTIPTTENGENVHSPTPTQNSKIVPGLFGRYGFPRYCRLSKRVSHNSIKSV